MSRISLFPRQSRLSRAVRGALAILALGATASAWAAGTGELPASAAGGAVPLTVTVQPGQSLNDIAKAATQSRDPGVLARAGRALFDANPQAFMKHDASRLKVGATLTVPSLDATGAALAPAAASAASGASGTAAASAPAAASGGTAVAQHGASAPHPGSTPAATVPSAPVAPAVHAAPVSGASVATAAGAAASLGASAAHGASAVESVQPAAPVAGASGPHVWSGAIQSAPSSASGAALPPVAGSQVSGMNEPAGAAPAAGASQPRPSSLQQLLALKNRVLMELQKHGIGKPATTNEVAPAPVPAPVAPRPAANDTGASAAAPAASEAASGVAASAAQPASVSAPAQPAAPVAAPARSTGQMDWRPAAVAGAAVIVLAAGFAWRKRRKGRRAEETGDAGTSATAAAVVAGGAAAAAAETEAAPSVEPELPIRPEMPVARDAASDLSLAAATAAAAETAETAETPDTDVSSAPEVVPTHDEQPELPAAHAVVPTTSEAAPAPHDTEPVEKIAAEKPAEQPAETPIAPAATETQHEALMQNAISALNSLDMPLPPRTQDEPSLATDESAAQARQSDTDKVATNGQADQRLPIGAIAPAPEHPADQDDEFDWDPDAATPAGQAGSPFATSSLPPLGGAQFGALKLDFDLDLPSTPGAALPALTPDELARIARNKLDLATEYVELGDLSGARTLLQEVVDANDTATRDDARALLAKLADEA
ncbi:pilus assembly protein FimV [Burkholderia cepacia]|uniref:Pilus assembly protein FimV n=1 Tax=Burkholderia cepacia TaxID=292 RepID=A0AAX2RXU3_BURCE|nr:FimV/HubP family polar landmark protein [Burkholderia cepacia]TES82701.1 pilus assembly protein FimV [Burkholderia cepacia]TET02922.1 pilus assembly protein FimV [Burkholderia cepacia]TEU37314.1 pilus assembly protein FimV [Burkholderia cepacia]TEU53380.1 pilus assembly protein FimV [Burkholderia cepacia]TEU76182.1 pilus assembly protein FimV [Burkholderia cepacia]